VTFPWPRVGVIVGVRVAVLEGATVFVTVGGAEVDVGGAAVAGTAGRGEAVGDAVADGDAATVGVVVTSGARTRIVHSATVLSLARVKVTTSLYSSTRPGVAPGAGNASTTSFRLGWA